MLMRASAVGLVMLLGAGTGLAQDTVLTNEGDPTLQNAGSPWASRCVSVGRQDAATCSVSERLVSQAGALLGAVAVQIAADGTASLVATLPLGLSIPAGVTIDVDKAAALKLDLQSCDRSACYATAAFSDGLRQSFEKGTSLNVNFQTGSKQAVTLPLTLKGFSAAFQKIRPAS